MSRIKPQAPLLVVPFRQFHTFSRFTKAVDYLSNQTHIRTEATHRQLETCSQTVQSPGGQRPRKHRIQPLSARQQACICMRPTQATVPYASGRQAIVENIYYRTSTLTVKASVFDLSTQSNSYSKQATHMLRSSKPARHSLGLSYSTRPSIVQIPGFKPCLLFCVVRSAHIYVKLPIICTTLI